MINEAAFSEEFAPEVQDPVLLSKPVCAIEVDRMGGERRKLGALVQLRNGITVQVCGPGFNERTIKVRFEGHEYFVFLQDIAEPVLWGAIA